MTRRLLVPLVVLAAWLVTSAPAAAAPPDRFLDLRFDPLVTEVDALSDVCGFEVTFTAKGRLRGTEYFDRTGARSRLVFHPSFQQTLTSEYGSVTTSDRGMDRITVNPDGTETIFGTGIHLRVKGGAYAIGRWVLVFDPAAGELVSAEYNGRFDVLAPEIESYLCELLGP